MGIERSISLVCHQSRVVPDTMAGLVEYFLDSEAREIEVEISRLRPRQVNHKFLDSLLSILSI